jgi:hypothetical protein
VNSRPIAVLWAVQLLFWLLIAQVQSASSPNFLPIAEPAPPSQQSSSDLQPEKSLDVCVTAIAAQSDPAKLATLGKRAANPRLKRIMYYLAQARMGGADPGNVVDQAQMANGSTGSPAAPLVKVSLLRNLKICDGLGLLTPENLKRLRHGAAPIVTRGPYTGETAEVDHIVPLAQAYEIGNELANLEMLPATLNRAMSDKVGERQLELAKKFRDAGLISEATMANIQAKFRPSSTAQYERSTPDGDGAETLAPSPTPLVTSPQAVSTTATDGSTAGERIVWVNTESHIYHLPHSHWYGKTREGKYMSETDAVAEGDRAAEHNM